MGALASVLITVTLALVITRIGAQALVMTGLSQQVAQFQARSAFTGVGFTTRDAEQVMNHPVRRRIVMMLMFWGNVGIIATISSLVLTFVSTAESDNWLSRLGLLGMGLGLLWLVASNRLAERWLSQLIDAALERWTDLDVRDYANLLKLSGDYQVTEMKVEQEDWMAKQRLEALNLRSEGILVLGIYRENGTYLGAPKGSSTVQVGDVLILYGRMESLARLDARRADISGELSHQDAIVQQQEVEAREEARDRQKRNGKRKAEKSQSPSRS